ncbi:osteoglycin, paralog a [Xenentodon cancila]
MARLWVSPPSSSSTPSQAEWIRADLDLGQLLNELGEQKPVFFGGLLQKHRKGAPLRTTIGLSLVTSRTAKHLGPSSKSWAQGLWCLLWRQSPNPAVDTRGTLVCPRHAASDGMKKMFFTCMLLLWLETASASRVEQDSGLMRGSLPGWQLSGYADYLKSRRARRALPPADEPDDSPMPEGEDASDLPTCLLCVCLTGSVYCEEVSPEMTSVPTLPKETAYLYARFNKIKKISTKDFADILTLKRIDLTGNLISEIEDGAFSKLSLLEELSLAENRLVKLPMLPSKLVSFNANHNLLKTKGVKSNAFKKLSTLANLYLADNQLEAVPHIPESVRILHLQNNNITEVNIDTFCKSNDTYYLRPSLSEVRMDGNPVVLSKYPDSFTCMKVLPVGQYR